MTTRTKIGILVLLIVVYGLWRLSVETNNNLGFSPVQPIPFSHKIHAGDMPIAFKADKAFEDIKLGEPSKNEYHFVNLSNDTIRFRPVHSILPENAATKLTLTKCFCFDDQIILPGQSYTLPVVFSFSPDLDPTVERITFHYTLFQKDLKAKK